MKLRLNRGSLRLRLSKSEVEEFGKTGRVEEIVKFGAGPQDSLTYRIEKSTNGEVGSTVADRQIVVYVPEAAAADWAESDQVGIDARQLHEDQSELRILIEKDFVCLTPRENEDQSDNYPHPKGDEVC